MEWVETTGRTVEEATKAALEQLGVDEADADVEVIAEPKLGLFGRLREEARVRARVQPRYPRSKVDRRDRRRPRSGAHTEQGGGEASVTSAPAAEAGPAPEGQRDRASKPRARTVPEAGAAPRRRRRSVSEDGSGEKSDAESTSFGEVTAEGLEEQAKLAETFLRGLATEMGATVTVSSHTVAEGIVEVELEGEGLGTLIGPKGATLAALQELTRTVLQRQTSAEGRVVVDINGYRKRRQESLARFAHEVAAEVRAKGVKRALEPMPPADRKVVHDAVNSIEGVRTISEGEEPERRVVLIPISADDVDDGDGGDDGVVSGTAAS